jgi:uncharacterized protein YraI
MRMRVACAAALGTAALSIASGNASAQSQAYTNQPVYLYAGPAQDYPVVAQLPSGQPLAVYGCVSGYTWCDVAIAQARGWVYGGYLTYPYQGSNVPIMTYGTTLGLPLISFSIGSYWDRYYRGRPWYADRSRWVNHPPPPNRPPPPPNRPPPPPHGAPSPNRPPPMTPTPPPPPGNVARPPGAGHGYRPPLQGNPPPQNGGRPPGPPPAHVERPSGPPPGQGGGGRPPGPPQGGNGGNNGGNRGNGERPPPSSGHGEGGTNH